jgi:hypothetical protein
LIARKLSLPRIKSEICSDGVWGGGDMAPHIFKVRTRGGWVMNFMSFPGQIVLCILNSRHGGIQGRYGRCLKVNQRFLIGRLARGLATMLTELSRLLLLETWLVNLWHVVVCRDSLASFVHCSTSFVKFRMKYLILCPLLAIFLSLLNCDLLLSST